MSRARGQTLVATLIVIFIAGWLLDRRGASEADRRIAESRACTSGGNALRVSTESSSIGR